MEIVLAGVAFISQKHSIRAKKRIELGVFRFIDIRYHPCCNVVFIKRRNGPVDGGLDYK